MSLTLPRRKLPIILLLLTAAVLIWSAIQPNQYGTWFAEVLPTLIVAAILVVTYKRFQFTSFVYVLLFIFIVLPFIGGHYRYDEVPLFDWLQNQFGLTRNHFDRFVHFMQGFLGAIILREILIRLSPVQKGFWLFLFIISVIALNSTLYELTEFVAAVISGGTSHDPLGMQGDIWDTQWDMALALIGALLSLLLLWRAHDRALGRHMLGARIRHES